MRQSKLAEKPAAADKSVALVHGDDDFAVKQRAKELYQKWSAELGGEDHEIIEASVSNSGETLRVIGKLREALQTLPFFGSGKVVWLRNCNFLSDENAKPATAVTDALAELSQDLKEFSWDKVRLLITAAKVDKRKSIFKTLEKIGQVQSFESWSVNDKDWAARAEVLVRNQIRERGKRMGDGALRELVARVGPQSRQLVNEVEKLCLYAGDREEITLQDVEAISVRNKQARAFALGDALGDRNLARLLARLDEELWEAQFDRDKNEIGLLYGLIFKVRAVLLLKEMLQEGWLHETGDFSNFKSQLAKVPSAKLSEDKKYNPLALNPYVLFRALSQVKNYSSAELIRALELLLQANQRLVSSSLDERVVLQQVLIEIVGATPTPGRSSR